MTGNELRQIRTGQLAMSQRDLAAELDLPQNTLARWERGEIAIQHPRMLRLALETILREATVGI